MVPFLLQISALFHFCCHHKSLSLPHERMHKHSRKKIIMLRFLMRSLRSFSGSSWLLQCHKSFLAYVKCERATLKPGCTSRLLLTGREKTQYGGWAGLQSHNTYSQNIPEALHKETKQEAHRENCLISPVDSCSQNAFKGPAATQLDEADEICHRHNVTLGSKWLYRDRIKVEGQRCLLGTVRKLNYTSRFFQMK